MHIFFFVARLNIGPKQKTAETFLRHQPSGPQRDFEANDQSLSAFCFPLGPDNQSAKEYMAPEEYIITLTKSDGTRLQGFCRRYLPPAPKMGSRLRYAQVMCLICEAPWSSFFAKVLQVLEQLLKQTDLLLDYSKRELPPACAAAQFLNNLAERLKETPDNGALIRVPLPKSPVQLSISPPRRLDMETAIAAPLQCTSEFIELQVPPDCGNGKWNAGVSLARLLWHVPIPSMLTLISSLLLERRVILVGQSRDMVSAAVHAAAALLYPFRWHHIYLPLLPKSFKDYLTAPMPFLIGLHAQLLPILKGIPMNEVTMIDLDLGRCEPAPGSPADDAMLLPWRKQLEAALTTAYTNLRSPTEYESNPFITDIMREYVFKLMGGYRSFIHPLHPAAPAPQAVAGAPGSPDTRRNSVASNSGSSARSSLRDDTMSGHGYCFDHASLVASHRFNETARNFLSMFRHSQMYEQFVQERLALAAAGYPPTDDTFESRLNEHLERRSKRLASRLSAMHATTLSMWGAMLKKHGRRTDGVSGTLSRSSQGSGGPGSYGMRRNTTDPHLVGMNRTDANHTRSVSESNSPMAGRPDTTVFFDDDEEDELYAIEEAAQQQQQHAASAAASAAGKHRPEDSSPLLVVTSSKSMTSSPPPRSEAATAARLARTPSVGAVPSSSLRLPSPGTTSSGAGFAAAHAAVVPVGGAAHPSAAASECGSSLGNSSRDDAAAPAASSSGRTARDALPPPPPYAAVVAADAACSGQFSPVSMPQASVATASATPPSPKPQQARPPPPLLAPPAASGATASTATAARPAGSPDFRLPLPPRHASSRSALGQAPQPSQPHQAAAPVPAPAAAAIGVPDRAMSATIAGVAAELSARLESLTPRFVKAASGLVKSGSASVTRSGASTPSTGSPDSLIPADYGTAAAHASAQPAVATADAWDPFAELAMAPGAPAPAGKTSRSIADLMDEFDMLASEQRAH